jgi:Cytochrome c554 and c-prime/Doubled CXXCH motif (Paired_CXXCH_1)
MKVRILLLAVLLVLVAMTLAACSLGGTAPTPTARVVEVTKVVEKPVTQIVEKTVDKIVEKPVTVVVQVTPVPQTPVTTAANGVPPTVELVILPIAANAAADPNVITATFSYVTSTQVGAAKGTVAMGQTGLDNVSIGAPVTLQVNDLDVKNPSKKWTWSLTAPPDSKSTLAFTNTVKTKFTPDVVGWYRVTVTAGNAAGNAAVQGVQVHADTYVGMDKGKCVTCHPTKVNEWAKTGHSKIFAEEVSGGADPTTTHYTETCIRCHTTGWYVDSTGKAVANGGFADVQAKTGWKFPTFAEMGEKAGGIWDAVPADLKNVSNIQCEACHGPAGDHVKNGATTMAGSISEGVCNVCHNGGGTHIKGTELANAKHSEEDSPAWNEPTGASRQACVRCHSGDGYISFIENPKNPAAWATNKQVLTCTTCHDPHDDKNPFQLRIVGKPVELPVDLPDVGLSATCVECHNGRTKASAAPASFPHYSAAAEFVYNQGGVDYGTTLVNSLHGMIVGADPVADPADKTGKTMLFGGNKPGACVTCHMWPTITDAKDPNYLKVGAHSFNTVSPDGKFDYGAACKSCHGDVTDFNLKARGDYDGNGKVEGVQDEVKGLLNLLWAEFEKAGYKKQDGNPYITDTAKFTDKQKQAWYNFRLVYGVMWTGEGKAAAIHNFKRSVNLLQLSYKDLTGKDVPGATIMK